MFCKRYKMIQFYALLQIQTTTNEMEKERRKVSEIVQIFEEKKNNTLIGRDESYEELKIAS